MNVHPSFPLLGHTDGASTESWARSTRRPSGPPGRADGDLPVDTPPARWEDEADLLRWLRALCRPESSPARYVQSLNPWPPRR